MSYKRVRPRNSKTNRNKLIPKDIEVESCPIPTALLNTFIEENPNASESAQIEAFFGEPMIPVFNENVPNLINISKEKMAEYKRQRQLVDKINAVKRQKTKHLSHESSGTHFSSSFEPFFTLLIKVLSDKKPTKEDIRKNLEHLGVIEDIVLYSDGYDYQFAFVRFESSEVALDLSLNWNQIKFSYNSVRNISIQAFPKRSRCSGGGYELCAVMRPIDRQVLAEKVRNSLKSGQHINEMKRYLLMTETDRQNRLILCNKLESVLNSNQILCKFHIFGSTVNELGFCDSDIDVFIEIIEENNLRQRLDASLAVDYLIRIREMLGKVLRMYIRPTIQSRRCPLVKLDFRQFGDSMRVNGMSCDLSLVNSLGIINSKLIAFYCKLEPHFHTMAVVLRYLAKNNDFIGSSQMSSYAFSMLIIFFCQTLSVPLLPTVDTLIEMKTKSVVMNGIECGFCDDVHQYRQTVPFEWNEIPINGLFELFFEFYSRFDFRSYVLCPRSGRTIHKTKFNNYLNSYGVTNVQEFQMTELICIQDPFDLTFNMAHHMPYKLFLQLRTWFMKVSVDSHQYFSQEFTDEENVKTFVDLLEPNNHTIEGIKKLIQRVNTIGDDNEVEIIECFTSKYFIAELFTNFETNSSEEVIDGQLDDWAVKVSHFFRLLMRDGFKMKCFYDSKPKSQIKLKRNNVFETFSLKLRRSDRRIINKKVRESTVNQMQYQTNSMSFIALQTLITEIIEQNSEECLIIDDNSEEDHFIRINLELCLEEDNKIMINITDVMPQNDSIFVKNLIEFICHSFRTGLQAEQLLTIDDDICIVN